MESYDRTFHNAVFMDPTDPYRLALVNSGLKRGHSLYDVAQDEITEWGVCETQGKDVLQRRLEVLDMPYSLYESSVTVDPAYGEGMLSLYHFYVAENDAWLERFADVLEDEPVPCGTTGTFEGFPECCINEFCTEYNAGNRYETELKEHMVEQEPGEHEQVVLSILPSLSHFPCSPECETSVAMGEQYLTFFENQYPEAYNYYIDVANDRLAELDVND